MNHKATWGGSSFLLAAALLTGSAEKPSFQTAKTQAVDLYRAVISSAAPPIRAKITASARAARAYMANCGRSCDLHAFLAKDLGRRFSTKKQLELEVLEALAFGEAFADISEVDQMALQDAMQKQPQLIQLISNINKSTRDTLKAIIQNMRG